VAFIDQQREGYGAEPIYTQLPIAPATHFKYKAWPRDPARRAARRRRDGWLQIAPSGCSRGDSCDNALAESVTGLFKAEVLWRHGSRRTTEHVESATLEWVGWFSTRRLLEPTRYLPPAEYEAAHRQRAELVSATQAALQETRGGSRKPH
jgi:transposase InsO family protein